MEGRVGTNMGVLVHGAGNQVTEDMESLEVSNAFLTYLD